MRSGEFRVLVKLDGSVAFVKKLPFYANNDERFKNNFVEYQRFTILDCQDFD